MIQAERIATWLPVTRQSLDDARGVRELIREAFRLGELRMQGFVGWVRCARCGRRARCVYTVGDRLYGSSCYRLVGA